MPILRLLIKENSLLIFKKYCVLLPVKLINVSRSSTRVSKLVHVSRRYYTCLEASTRVSKILHVSRSWYTCLEANTRVSTRCTCLNVHCILKRKNIVYLHTASVRTWYVSYTILIRTLSVTIRLKITNSQNLVDLVRDGLIKKRICPKILVLCPSSENKQRGNDAF